nr:MAG TPA: hypothetical protein [Caudoviricetes sp.]
MKIIDNGELRDATQEEIESLREAEAFDHDFYLPTYEDRLSALESALLEMITGGETDG